MALMTRTGKVVRFGNESVQRPDIKAVGVGGAGCNILNCLIDEGVHGIEMIAVNTPGRKGPWPLDEKHSVYIGPPTGGLMKNPEMSEKAVMGNMERIRNALKGAHVTFILCGLGGMTGTGAVPVIADGARRQGSMVIVVAIEPFRMEGPNRRLMADVGKERLRRCSDGLVLISNDILLQVAPNLGFEDALRVVNRLAMVTVRDLADLATEGDLRHIKDVMSTGESHLGWGETTWDQGVQLAVEQAVSKISGKVAKGLSKGGILIVTSSNELEDRHVDSMVDKVLEHMHPEAKVLLGHIKDQEWERNVRMVALISDMARRGGDGDVARQRGGA
jgi:cell division protein FtsZ